MVLIINATIDAMWMVSTEDCFIYGINRVI